MQQRPTTPRTPLPTLREVDRFDPDGYLRRNPGVAAAVERGAFKSAWHHWDLHGRAEGRAPDDVDPGYYRATYGQAEHQFGPLTDDGCGIHYAAFGRARGYRANAHAPRDRAARTEAATGLWTDAPDARDRIDALEAMRRITDRHAVLLRQWREDGLLLLDRPLPRTRLTAAREAMERLFAGLDPAARFRLPDHGAAPQGWSVELPPLPAELLDPHGLARPVRQLLLDDATTEIPRLLLEDRLLLAGSTGMLRPPATPPRRASATFGCTLARRFVTLVAALDDDVRVSVWRHAHRLPPLPIAGRHPNLPEALHQGLAQPEAALAAYDASLARLCAAAKLTEERLPLGRGRAVLLHPDMVAAVLPPGDGDPRRCLVAQLCPWTLLPASAERTPATLRLEGRDLWL